MDVTVSAAQGLPEKAYVSIRVGEVRKQVLYKQGAVPLDLDGDAGDGGERFHFDVSQEPRHITVDVFERVATTLVSMSSLTSSDEHSGIAGRRVELQGRNGKKMSFHMDAKVLLEAAGKNVEEAKTRVSRAEAAVEAKNYLDQHGVHALLQKMVRELLAVQPEDAVQFMQKYLQEHDRDFKSTLADGRDVQASLSQPDLSERHSIAAQVMRETPSIYAELKDKKSPGEVPFLTCVKACFENVGHPMIQIVGAVAGDESCYDAFSALFDPVIRIRHPGYSSHVNHRTDVDVSAISSDCIDPSGLRVIGVSIRVSRNLSRLRFMPDCSYEERRRAEQILVQAFSSLTENFKGEYFPICGSLSFAQKPSGMSEDEEDAFREENLLFEEPDSAVLISSGYDRDWPDARGIFVNADHSLSAWINEADHIRLMATQSGCDMKTAFEKLYRCLAAVEDSLKTAGFVFARHERLGFLGSCPSMLGTCLAASATIRIPLLSAQPKFRALCRRLNLQAHLGVGPGMTVGDGVWEVTNSERIGTTEVQQVNAVIAACRALLDLEERLHEGEDVTAHIEAS